jgi:hypothetical protein
MIGGQLDPRGCSAAISTLAAFDDDIDPPVRLEFVFRPRLGSWTRSLAARTGEPFVPRGHTNTIDDVAFDRSGTCVVRRHATRPRAYGSSKATANRRAVRTHESSDGGGVQPGRETNSDGIR